MIDIRQILESCDEWSRILGLDTKPEPELSPGSGWALWFSKPTKQMLMSWARGTLCLLAEKFRNLQSGDRKKIDDRKDSDRIHDNEDHKPERLAPPARMPKRESFPKAFPQDQERKGGSERMQTRWCPEARPNIKREHLPNDATYCAVS